MRHRKDAVKAREISRQRIERLFQLAAEELEEHPERSDRYAEIARKICTRMRIRMPRYLKAKFCRHCGCYLPASLTRVRLRDGILTTTCLRCGHQARRPYFPREKDSRAQHS